ncbi:MAG TPA: FixH family protein [Polyangiaceae bacterium]|jgi:hypothetical protein|nr:FixH family protein [Polyangiaceae bacterium]
MRLKFALFLLALLGTSLCDACSSSSGDPSANTPGNPIASSDPDSGLADEEVSCQADPRVNPYTLPLTLSGAAGYEVTLADRTPDPSARGLNQWTISMSDANGAALVGAQLVFATSMPDHGHSSDAPIAPPTDAQGNVTVSGLDFFMAGVWRIQIDVYPATSGSASGVDPADTVAFMFCVEG